MVSGDVPGLFPFDHMFINKRMVAVYLFDRRKGSRKNGFYVFVNDVTSCLPTLVLSCSQLKMKNFDIKACDQNMCHMCQKAASSDSLSKFTKYPIISSSVLFS